jgi:hypothetical protein
LCILLMNKYRNNQERLPICQKRNATLAGSCGLAPPCDA